MDRQRGFFDLDERYRKLSEVGDPLTRLKELVDFELFYPALSVTLKHSDRSKGGRSFRAARSNSLISSSE